MSASCPSWASPSPMSSEYRLDCTSQPPHNEAGMGGWGGGMFTCLLQVFHQRSSLPSDECLWDCADYPLYDYTVDSLQRVLSFFTPPWFSSMSVPTATVD